MTCIVHKTMPTTYVCEYKILPEHATRESCMTFFGGMTQKDDLDELGDVRLLGRWSCVGEARGFCVVTAANNVAIQKWLNNWVTMADVKVTPCLDDNQHRRLIMDTEPAYTVAYDRVNDPEQPNDSLYVIKYQFKEDCIEKGFVAFANMTCEQDQADSGECTSYGRWHVPSQGCGYAVASSPSAEAVYKWAHNWSSLCSCSVHPVTRDEDTRRIIKEGRGFDAKHAKLMEQLSSLAV